MKWDDKTEWKVTVTQILLKTKPKPPKLSLPHKTVNGKNKKTIGLIGGMSWESTIPYYRIINQTVKQNSVVFIRPKWSWSASTFTKSEALQRASDWDRRCRHFGGHSAFITAAGADFLVICTNTMHKVAKAIEDAVSATTIPYCRSNGTRNQTPRHTKNWPTRHALHDGTRFLQAAFAGSTRTRGFPNSEDMDIIHRIIYQSSPGKIEDASLVPSHHAQLVEQGAQGHPRKSHYSHAATLCLE